MSSLDRSFFEAYYRTYNSEDAEALRAFYHDDLVMVSAQGEQHGVQALLDTYHYLIDNFEDRMTPETILINGDTAAIEISDVFTAKKPVADFMGATFRKGDQLTLNLCAVYRVRAGKITHATIYAR